MFHLHLNNHLKCLDRRSVIVNRIVVPRIYLVALLWWKKYWRDVWLCWNELYYSVLVDGMTWWRIDIYSRTTYIQIICLFMLDPSFNLRQTIWKYGFTRIQNCEEEYIYKMELDKLSWKPQCNTKHMLQCKKKMQYIKHMSSVHNRLESTHVLIPNTHRIKHTLLTSVNVLISRCLGLVSFLYNVAVVPLLGQGGMGMGGKKKVARKKIRISGKAFIRAGSFVPAIPKFHF